ncbi:MAG: nitroreductase family protein [Gammaproteobacteria bacterium]|jgi:nitroreductase
MTLDEIMRTNGTCRYYTTGPVDDDALRRVLDGARWAPTGGNRQPLRFIAVRDPAKKRRLKALYLPLWNDFLNAINAGEKQYDARPKLLVDADYFANHLEQIPVMLIVCVRLADVQPTDAALDRLSVVGGASIYPAVQNVLLAARAEGLGSALTTLLCAAEPDVKTLLGIPDDVATAAMVTIGWPARPFPRKLNRRPLAEFAFTDTYGDGAFDA